ncbi:MAG: GrpB family protein [Steroidobacteraceae bacterium]
MYTSKCNRVLVVDYDPSWPAKFEELRRGVWPAVRDVALSIEHVGSTAVAGLAAKPIIDMDVGELGYVHRGNLGIEDREAFASPLPSPAHHLYVCPQSSAALANHLALRDFLRRNPEAVAEYGRVKRQLAARFATDMASYIAGKTDCILAMLRKMGFSESTLQSIKNANISSD